MHPNPVKLSPRPFHLQVVVLLLTFIFPLYSPGSSQAGAADTIRLVSKVADGHIAVYESGQWRPRFWTGVNLGATTPGHFPGELSPTKDDYRRWFRQMKQMNARLVRVYTILPPDFYDALAEFNASQLEPLWLLQGIWPPDEELTGADGNGKDAFNASITAQFRAEISDAVRAVHGDLIRPARPGHASGRYSADVSAYILGWLAGCEWHPLAVKVTNDSHPGMAPFSGTYFQATTSASPFEKWLAMMLEQVAIEEMRYGWQHPMAFVNWPTTDPLPHPTEPNPQEDMVSVDPTHVTATPAWQAGYYAAYHVYPYYPDFLRYDPQYQTYRDALGNQNPYAGYLHDLRARHSGLAVVIAEFGVPSSRGLAHRGPLGRDQGMHTEAEQGKIDAELLASIYSEGYDGGVVFSWIDEWWKATWNTTDLSIPQERRPLWFNRLTNEQCFGMIAAEPGPAGSAIVLDGNSIDWDRTRSRVDRAYPALALSVSHDEAHLYLLLRNRARAWDFLRDEVNIGFQTLSGGSRIADRAPGIAFSQPIEFLLNIKGAADAHLYVSSAYDQHIYRWGYATQFVPFDSRYPDPANGLFVPWKLLLARSLVLPLTGQKVPAEEAEIGVLRMGITDPDSSDYDDLADWYAKQHVLEVRIPWMMLGFTDPSTPFAWNWPYLAGKLEPTAATGVLLEVHLSVDGKEVYAASPLLYSWKRWDLPQYHERPKISYTTMRDALAGYDLPLAIAKADLVPVVNSILPASVVAGGPPIKLTVTGLNFLPSTVVRWNGSDRNTTFVSGSQLIASLAATDTASVGMAQITLFNAPPGGGASRPSAFSIVGGAASPAITSAGLVNAASFSGLFPAAGSIASLFGSNLASSPLLADALPLPTALGGVTVRINDLPAPLLFVSPGQINFQIPWELLGQTQAALTVTVAGLTSRPATIYPSAVAPGIFSVNSQGSGQGAISIANTQVMAAPVGSLAGKTTRPAKRGEFITIFCTGLGDVTNRPASGAAVSTDPLAAAIANPSVMIGNVAAPVTFAGLAPGFVGLYQVDVRVPENAPVGSAVPVLLTAGNVASNAVTMAVE